MRYTLDHAKKTYRLWGNHPAWYGAACWITFLGKEKFLRERTVATMRLQRGDTVLDLACGTGRNFPFLENAVGETGAIIAFDYSQEMLAQAKKRAEKYHWNNITYIHGDAAELTLKKPVDGIISTLGISAIPQHKQALQRAVAHLKPNGAIAILDARLPTGIWRIANPLIAFIYKHWADWDYTKNIPGDLQALLPAMQQEIFNGGTMYIATATKS